ncbi:MAG: hypothetical protein ABJA78_14620 [Ferruginibacter sp.]
MKKLYILFLSFQILLITVSAQVGINTTNTPAHPSAMLDISSSDKGLLIPRTSAASRTAIANPAKGLMIYDTNSNSLWIHNGAAWAAINPVWVVSGLNIHSSNGGNVGINNPNPNYNLDIGGYMHCSNTAYLDNNLILNGYLTTGGKGIVRSNTPTQQKIVRTQATFSYTNMPAYTYQISAVFDYEDFGGIPTVCIGGSNNGNGSWHQILIQPMNITATGCQFVLYNTAPTAATFTNVSWQVFIIGPE